MKWPPVKFWMWAGLILATSAIIHWKRTQGQVESARQALMARQRGVSAELGPRWFPLRDAIEGFTTELANAPSVEKVVDRDALAKWDFRAKAGIYLRLPVGSAKDAKAIRSAAKESLRDGFTACLMRVPNENPLAGKECKRTRDCPTGESCNELDRCAKPAQPYNLRVAYRTMRVLSDEWVQDAQDAGTKLRLELLATSFDDTVRDDIPVAVDLLTRAQYFLVVLDEPPADPPKPEADGGVSQEALLTPPHAARVGLLRLSDHKVVLRMRADAGGELLGMPAPEDAEVAAARQRQANSCALAVAVREAIGDANAGGSMPE